MKANKAADSGNLDQAMELLRPVSKQSNLVPWLMRLEWAVQRSRSDELDHMLAQISKIQNGSALAKLIQAYRLMMLNDVTPERLKQAKAILDELLVATPQIRPGTIGFGAADGIAGSVGDNVESLSRCVQDGVSQSLVDGAYCRAVDHCWSAA